VRSRRRCWACLFNRPETLAGLLAKLARGYAFDAIDHRREGAFSPRPAADALRGGRRRRGAWETTRLAPGDRVETVTPKAGG